MSVARWDGSGRVSSLDEYLQSPSVDLAVLLERLSCKLITRDRPVIQYVAWAQQAGLFDLLATANRLSSSDLILRSPLNEAGVDALLGVLCSLELANRRADGTYELAAAGWEYFMPESPFFIGDQLYAPRRRIPRAYIDSHPSIRAKLAAKVIMSIVPTLRFGAKERLANQHARNLSAGVAAVRTARPQGMRCIVDLAGGSGTFSIPLALAYPDVRIVLAELPRALKNVRHQLAKHKLLGRIEVVGVNALSNDWDLPECDGIFIGNFLHGLDDPTCLGICRRVYEHLSSGGRIWVHEMIWNERKRGPMIVAMWNATMRMVGGRQRTAEELTAMLGEAGFIRQKVDATAAAFSLISADKA